MSFPLLHKRTFVHRDVQQCLSRHPHSELLASSPSIAQLLVKQRAANINDRTVLLYDRAKKKLVIFGGIWQANPSGSLTLRSPASYAAKTYQHGLKEVACNCCVDPTIPHEAAIPRAEKRVDTGLYALVCHKKPNLRADGTLDYSNTCGLNVLVFNFNDTDPRTVASAAQLPPGAVVIPAKPRSTPASSDVDIDLTLLFDDEDDTTASPSPVASSSKRKADTTAGSGNSLLYLHVPMPALKRRKSAGDDVSNDAPIEVPASSDSKMRRLTRRARELIRLLFTPDAGLDVDGAKELDELIGTREKCSICGLQLAQCVFKEHILQPSHMAGN
ncbi:hypothetical protein AURDEDRAFT_131050 [Auricularia subglabra TFB-10046 SS5]|uniref:Uncharacterized protein n=1 Tax=Auricularia subglabra (strain TFB-10046 / SS5) TaxID=717982 RepID=J0D6W5_AURST|nr:hypothetical protein AURDEDRAFT_131050 [Auricularia subglabra TFB-10046 SS5]